MRFNTEQKKNNLQNRFSISEKEMSRRAALITLTIQ